MVRKKSRGTRRAPKNPPSTHPAGSASGSSQTDPGVIAFLRKLEHRLKPELGAVRQLILDADPQIREGIKWNAPSFRTTDYFATLNLRAKTGTERVWLILHTGAKVMAKNLKEKIDDPDGLLEWLAKDRCLVTFGDASDVNTKGAALQAIVREWIRFCDGRGT